MMFSAAERETDSPSHSGRHWSLWEMLTLKSERFYSLAQCMVRLHKIIEKAELDNNSVYPTKDSLKQNWLIYFFRIKRIPYDIYSSNNALVTVLSDQCIFMREICISLDLPLSTMAIDRFIEGLKKNTFSGIKNDFLEIDRRIKDELSSVGMLLLNNKEYKMYSSNKRLFGEDFQSNFQTAGIFELDEAAKCLAIGRSTASVFHLMRLMEIGIASIAKCLNIPDPVKPSERNWGKILDLIDGGIKRKWPTSSDRMTGDGLLFEGLYASLDAVKNPWRNGTMHVENKYTEEEAEHIFLAVNGFMKKLASRMDENGEPKA